MSTLFAHLEPPAAVQPSRGMVLRDYQQAAIEGIFEAWESHRSTLAVLPTGVGKTVIFSSTIARLLERPKAGRVMVLAHRAELVHQAAEKIELITGERPDIEMADYRATGRRRVVVASKDSLRGGRLTRFEPSEFDAVITDEAHHATAKSYTNIYDWFTHHNPAVKFLGVTATPDRHDEAALGKVFESVAYVYEIQDAIRDGYLVPVAVQTVEVEGLDLSSIRTQAGDLNQKQLNELMQYEKPLHGITHPTIEITCGLKPGTIDALPDDQLDTLADQCPQRMKSLVFAVSVAHAERLAEIFNRWLPSSARWICGETPEDERKATLRDYAHGSFQYLINVGVFTEGFDEPGIEAVILARPTKSRPLCAQMVGRGTRPLPDTIDGLDDGDARRAAIAESGKPRLLVIDFAGNTGKHKLVSPADVLGGNYSDEAVAKAKKKKGKGGEPVDVLDALEQAENDIEAKKRRKLRAKAKYSTGTVDPFNVLDLKPNRERGWDRGAPPTDRQLAFLKGRGVETEGLTKASASQLIGTLNARQDHGWCTFKQAKLLRQFNIDPAGVRFEDASRLINQCFAGERPSNDSIQRSRPEPVGVDRF